MLRRPLSVFLPALLALLAAVAAACLLGTPTALAAEGESAPAAAAPEQPKQSEIIAIPVASIVVRGSALAGVIRGIEASFAAPPEQAAIEARLPALETEIRTRAARLTKVLQESYDRGVHESALASWRSIRSELEGWQSLLTARLRTLDQSRAELAAQTAIWEKTAVVAREERAPAEVREVVTHSLAALRSASQKLRQARDASLSLQRSVVDLQSRAEAQLAALALARQDVLRHILRRNQPLPWNVELGDVEAHRRNTRLALESSAAAIDAYVDKRSQRLALHGLLLVVLAWTATRARRNFLASRASSDHPLPASLAHPIPAALVLGLTSTLWFHPDAPPQFAQLASVVVLPFWFVVLRDLLPSSLRAPLVGFLLLFPLELLRQVSVSFELLSRATLILEAAAYFGGIFWLRRPVRLAAVPSGVSSLWTRLLAGWLHFALVASGIAAIAAIAGWTSFADLLVSTVARGSFTASILFTAVRVTEDVAEASAYSSLLRGIRTIHGHPERFLRVVERVARGFGLFTWVYLVLDYLALRSGILDLLRVVVTTPLGYGNVQVTLGGLIAFGVAIWLSWLLSRLIAAILDGDVFTRVRLPRGVPFALSTISRYLVLVLGFIAAMAALGIQVGNLALLLSALGVGIGFGMQNIVNNFISGLILLFERPIKVGDRVSLDTLLGEVRRIGIRASVLRTFDGADVIVPNGDLISNQVTNWTLADQTRRVIVPIGVAYGTPARKVIDLLLEVARGNDEILEDPAPVAIFTGFGESSLDFELRYWSESADALTLVRSAVAVAIQDALAAADIEVPFPQRDVHIKGASAAPDATPGPR